MRLRPIAALGALLLVHGCVGAPTQDAGAGGGGGVLAGGGSATSGGGSTGGGTGGGEVGGGGGAPGGGGTATDAGTPDAGLVCPPPAASSAEGLLPWGEVLQLRMASDFITWFQVPPSMGNFHSVVLTQGQQPSTPAGVVTEFYVSRCRGVIDPSGVPQCYYRNVFVNNNAITIYRAPVMGWTDQATLGVQGCWAPESEGPWYANVRWTYASCPFASCGFSMQWTLGPY